MSRTYGHMRQVLLCSAAVAIAAVACGGSANKADGSPPAATAATSATTFADVVTSDPFKVTFDTSSELLGEDSFVWQSTADLTRWDYSGPRDNPVVGSLALLDLENWFGDRTFGCLYFRDSPPARMVDISCDSSLPRSLAMDVVLQASLVSLRSVEARTVLNQTADCYSFNANIIDKGPGTLCVNEQGIPVYLEGAGGAFSYDRIALQATAITEPDEGFVIPEDVKLDLDRAPSVTVSLDVIRAPREVLD